MKKRQQECERDMVVHFKDCNVFDDVSQKSCIANEHIIESNDLEGSESGSSENFPDDKVLCPSDIGSECSAFDIHSRDRQHSHLSHYQKSCSEYCLFAGFAHSVITLLHRSINRIMYLKTLS